MKFKIQRDSIEVLQINGYKYWRIHILIKFIDERYTFIRVGKCVTGKFVLYE